MERMRQGDVVLFENAEAGEQARVVCRCAEDGGFEIVRTTRGDLSWWCFGESPHESRMLVGRDGARRLMNFYEAGSVSELTEMLGIVFVGIDAPERIWQVTRRLEMTENYFEKIA